MTGRPHTSGVPAAHPSRRTALRGASCALLAPWVGWARAGHGAAAAPHRPLAVDAAVDVHGGLWILSGCADDGLQLGRYRSGGVWACQHLLPTGGERVNFSAESAPRLAWGPQGRLAVAFSTMGPRRHRGQLRVLTGDFVHDGDSLAAGSAPRISFAELPAAGAEAVAREHAALNFDGAGRLHLAWLERQSTDPATRDRVALHRAATESPNGRFGPAQRLGEAACECCRTAIALGENGQVAVLWRHVFEGRYRDHAFHAGGEGAAIQRVGTDRWALEACPHHGPSLAPAAGGGYHAVWYTHRAGEGQVFYARLGSDGSMNGPERALPDEQAEHAAVASAGLKVAVIWRAFEGAQQLLRAWFSVDGGRRFRVMTLARRDGESDHPRLAAGAGRLFAVWNTEAGLVVKELS
ncbi:hypothetical protein [Inhella proteolytica]|uniref:Uncharacterized protein n=1 Tax=Inhella proteolytica TaxID=2795029 RepID=A0A931J9S5_9BURK|nr:hypothetical protein [Inhella proteolytica]MBH9578685.1 hypothetical protein [Inhella proteolytica]